MSKIFSHGVLEAYPGGVLDKVPGVEFYGARVLASSNPGDLVQIEPVLSRHTEIMLAHYARVGLKTATDFLTDTSYDALRNYPSYTPDFFYFGRKAHNVRPDNDFLKLAAWMNSKNGFVQFCIEQGYPVPHTAIFQNPGEVDTSSLGFPCYVKGDCSASGQHVILCQSPDEVDQAVMHMNNGPFQIQEALPQDTIFLNAQYYEERGSFRHGPITRQILDGTSHDGNLFPSGIDIDLVQPIIDKFSWFLFRQGMKGVWAFDVAVHGDKVWLIEINPRWNGSTYASIPAERLGVKEWESWNVKVPHHDLGFLALDGLEFNPDTKSGLVLINWGTIEHGKLGFLLAGGAESRAQLKADFRARFVV